MGLVWAVNCIRGMVELCCLSRVYQLIGVAYVRRFTQYLRDIKKMEINCTLVSFSFVFVRLDHQERMH
jgi:hypothetical protein